jgi:predicted transcriptional regulator
MQTVSVKFPVALLRKVDREARRRDRPRGYLIREAVERSISSGASRIDTHDAATHPHVEETHS